VPQYHFHRTDNEGRLLHGVTILLPSDEVALAKARELADGCNVEIWQDQIKVRVIHSQDPRTHTSFP
jgi:hypothetical protein